MTRTKRGQFRIHGGERQSSNVLRSDLPFLSLYCRGPVASPHKKWLIGSLLPFEHEGSVIWHESESGYIDPRSDTLKKIFPPFTKWLDGDTFIPRESPDPSAFSSNDFRVVWDLECPKCKFSRRIKAPADFYPVIAKLYEKGIDEIPVREFLARVGSST